MRTRRRIGWRTDMKPDSTVPKSANKRPPGGSRKGRPNRVTKELKEMILAALDQAGGVQYLYGQALENPKAFLPLLGKVLPLQVTGEGGGDIVIKVMKLTDG